MLFLVFNFLIMLIFHSSFVFLVMLFHQNATMMTKGITIKIKIHFIDKDEMKKMLSEV